jgi:hypothetical protein
MRNGVKAAVDMQVLADVILDKGEVFVAQKILDVRHRAGQQIVHGNDMMSSLYQPFAKMTAQKPGPPRN